MSKDNQNDVKFFTADGFRKWVDESALNLVIQQKTSDINKIKKNFNVAYGPAARFGFLRAAKIQLSLPSAGIITTAFKLTDPEIPKSEIIFGFMYSEPRNENALTGHFIGTTGLIHQLGCISASLLSRDGEYRQRISQMLSIMTLYEHFAPILEDIEDHIQKKIDKYKWNIFTECFYPVDEFKKYSEELESDIIARRLPIRFLTLCWFAEFMNIYKKQKINHINKLFKVIMRFKDKSEVKHDLEFIENLLVKHGEETMYMLYNNVNCFNMYKRIGNQSQIKIGQKIIPLNLGEVQNPFNIRYKPWREYLICEKVQDLFINGICAGVPILGDYFFIRNARKTLFDNYVQYMKLEHSDLAVGIARKLIDAQKGTFKPRSEDIIEYGKGAEHDKIKPSDDQKLLNSYKDDEESTDSYVEIEEWLSNKFRFLHEKIKDPIDYAREEIIMSEMALCVTSEYVGRTFYDAINICTENEIFNNDIGRPYENYDIWAKYIFELIYTLYCLNSHKGVIHGDLHLNNFTIHPLYFNKFRDVSTLKKPHMLYYLDEHHCFAFPSRQYHTVIIDFSRSVIRPSMLDSFENFDITNAKKLKLHKDGKIQLIKPEERSEFLYEQSIRVLKAYETNFPDFTLTKKSSLSVLFSNNFDKLFPIFGGLDTYASIGNMILFFRKNGYDKKYDKQFKLIESIFNRVENELTDSIEKYLEDPKSLDRTTIPYLNKKILDEFFTEYMIINPGVDNLDKFLNENTVINVSFYNNKEIHHMDTIKNFPEYLHTLKYYGTDGKLYTHSTAESHYVDRAEYEKVKIKNLHYISNIAATTALKLF